MVDSRQARARSHETTRLGERAQRRFYGRRLGRPLRPGLKALIETLLPRVGVVLPGPGRRLEPRDLFGGAPGPVWLEIGFGGGEHLAWQAAQHPEVGLIGAEYFLQGVARLLRQIAQGGLDNVRIYHGDGRDLLDALPERSLDRVFVLFPDPWPKTRHQKRRLVQDETLDRLAAVMKDGVELRLATDDMAYLSWMLERLVAHPDFEWLGRGPTDWRRRPSDWPPTRYESKALEQGRRPVFLRFRRRARRLIRPVAGGEKPCEARRTGARVRYP
jgi:tRNA (guanine-N7-)-methyltransferase